MKLNRICVVEGKRYLLSYEGIVKGIEIFYNSWFELCISRFLRHCGKKCIKIGIKFYDEGTKNKGFNRVGYGWKDYALIYVCPNCGEAHEFDDWDYGRNHASNTVYYFNKAILDFTRKLKKDGILK